MSAPATPTVSDAQLTYRYLRLSLIAMVLLLTVAVLDQLGRGILLDSISAYFYTAARTIFVGSLLGVAVALIAIRGSLGIENLLLNIAGMLVPVIAAVPTTLRVGTRLPGSEQIVVCEAGYRACVPAELRSGVANAVTALLVVGGLLLLTAIVFAVVERAASPLLVTGLAMAGLLVLGTAAWFLIDEPSFMTWAHFVASGLFFGSILAVVLFNAFFVRRSPSLLAVRQRQRFAMIYTVIAILMAAALVAGSIAVILRQSLPEGGVPGLFFASETISIVLFATFWVFQTIQKWHDVRAVAS